MLVEKYDFETLDWCLGRHPVVVGVANGKTQYEPGDKYFEINGAEVSEEEFMGMYEQWEKWIDSEERNPK